MTLLEQFGAGVRARRIEMGLSQEKLAEFAEMHRTYMGGIERGERNLCLVNIVKLSKALRLKPSELMKVVDDFAEEKSDRFLL